MQMIGHGTRADLEVEVPCYRSTQERSIPEAFFEHFLMEKLLDFGRDETELT